MKLPPVAVLEVLENLGDLSLKEEDTESTEPLLSNGP